MCAITGIFAADPAAAVDETLLRAMNDSQAHRGPDQHGLYRAPGLGLAHRRLSIIDLAGGRQPLFNEDGSVVVVYNGEIYNFSELAAALTARGHRFATHCDTEVIVHAWEEWGAACLEQFRGMFAFALWDSARQTLFLARDRLGVKPLYYADLPDGTLIFASELKALMRHPRLCRALDPQAIEEYFTFGYVPEPRSIFRSVRKLPPGHYLTRVRGQPAAPAVRFWDIPAGPGLTGSEADLGAELIDRLREAVAIRLVAEVPLGAFLSGGVDSSAIVALMAQQMAAAGTGPVNTCAIAFGDPAFDETAYAEQVALRYRTNHHLDRVEPAQFTLIDQLADLYDEPFADSSALPTWQVCALARRRVTVALSGDGGDENLAGYRRYQWHLQEERWRGALPLGLRSRVFGPLGRRYPELLGAPRWLRGRATLRALARDSVAGYCQIVSVLDADLRTRLFSPALRRELQGYQGVEVLRRHAARCPGDGPLALVQYLDFKTYLPDDILTKVDRASMAHALEVRVPLLDHRLVEWLWRLPAAMKLRGNQGKWLFKQALEPLLPHHLLYRPKMGFAVPLAAWFRGPLAGPLATALAEPALLDSGLFDPAAIRSLQETHRSGRRDYSAALWSLLMFAAFVRRESGQPALPAADPLPLAAT